MVCATFSLHARTADRMLVPRRTRRTYCMYLLEFRGSAFNPLTAHRAVHAVTTPARWAPFNKDNDENMDEDKDET